MNHSEKVIYIPLKSNNELRCVTVVFPDHTHLFNQKYKLFKGGILSDEQSDIKFYIYTLVTFSKKKPKVYYVVPSGCKLYKVSQQNDVGFPTDY